MAAGGVDVVAFFEAEGGGNIAFGKDAAEGAAVVFGGTFPLEAFHGVVGDEVDEGTHALGPLGEDAGLFEVVIHSFDEDILEGEALLFLGDPIAECVEEFVEAPAVVHRHNFRAHFVGGAMKGNRESDLAGVVREFFDLRDEAGG